MLILHGPSAGAPNAAGVPSAAGALTGGAPPPVAFCKPNPPFRPNGQIHSFSAQRNEPNFTTSVSFTNSCSSTYRNSALRHGEHEGGRRIMDKLLRFIKRN